MVRTSRTVRWSNTLPASLLVDLSSIYNNSFTIRRQKKILFKLYNSPIADTQGALVILKTTFAGFTSVFISGMKILLNKSVQMLDFDMKTVIFWWITPLLIKQNRTHLLNKPSRSNGKTVLEAVNARLCDQTKHFLTLWLEADMVLDQILDRDTFNMQPGQRRPASVPLQDPSGSPALVGSSFLTRVWNTWIEEPESDRKL